MRQFVRALPRPPRPAVSEDGHDAPDAQDLDDAAPGDIVYLRFSGEPRSGIVPRHALDALA